MENQVNTVDLERICRLCLEDKNYETFHHIFDENLNNKIIILSGLEVLKTDTLPKKICRNCRYQLEKSYFLRIKSKECEKRLKMHIRLKKANKPSNVLCKDYKDDDDLEEFEQNYLDSYKYFDKEKERMTAEIDRLRQEVRTEFEIEKIQVIEEEVNRRLEEAAKSVLSLKSTPRNPPVILNTGVRSTLNVYESPSTKRKRCKVENNPITTDKLNLTEVFVQNGSAYEIVFEPVEVEENGVTTFETENTVEQNDVSNFQDIDEGHIIIEEMTEDDDNDDSSYCDSNTKQKKSNLNETKKSDIKSLLSVKLESESYYKKVDETGDVEVDEAGEKKIFQCPLCPLKFTRRQNCKTHYYTHTTPNSPFTCEFCSKGFKSNSAMERHRRVHTGIKPFVCEICQKTFNQNELLKRHMSIHLDVAPFKCDQCSKRFKQKDPLKQHIAKFHSNNPITHPFDCIICQKSFAHSSGLSRHMLIHNGKTFTCKICPRAFNDKSALKRHETVHIKKQKAPRQ
ncbi:unnamed protein product [Diamesa tonsa]